ncbi:MAG: hypothetical protein KJ914_03805 [Gammaproteobacteria bacterium]|nr:hypothetical protein [Gammaproteobacteria bacterium]MBU1722662.1 hypothetical protein [Gammaproteobacteria bacterium]MBU2006709.1 hypothetical protein [Gammaproteobacteria bacterium]
MSIRANITDNVILKNIQSNDVEFYLLKRSWSKIKQIAGSVIYDSPDKKLRIWVPLAGGLEEDFVLSMGKLLNSLSAYEDRSQLDIAEDFDIFHVGDVIRVGSEDPLDKTSSTFPLYSAAQLIEQAKQVLLTGASIATIKDPKKNRAFFGSRKPNDALEYMKSVRLGQTERGSYIIKLISPLPNDLKETQFNLELVPEKPPFERLAVEKTFLGLSSLKDVLVETKKMGKFYFEPFFERINDGINADLCEAIVGKPDGSNKNPLNFSVSWSPAFRISTPEHISTRIEFPVEYFSYISQAAQEFRKKEPENIKFYGYVITLHQDKDSDVGDVTVATHIEGVPKKIRMTLASYDHQVAIKAYEKRDEVQVIGVLDGNKLIKVTKFDYPDLNIDWIGR